jgi:membrane protease YdiL (CAAX protease family)
MAIPASAALDMQKTKNPPLWEILAVMFVSLGITLISPNLKIISLLIPIIYLAVERRVRRRTWTDLGFGIRDIPAKFGQNIGWIVLVAVIIQAVVAFGSYYFLPEYAHHIIERIPFDLNTISERIILLLGISTLGEEIIYRSLFQGRLKVYLHPAAAILLSSLVFALMHFSPGPALIVGIDLLSVFIDSVIFGIIFQRSNNVFVAWIAHFVGDLVGIVFLLMI